MSKELFRINSALDPQRLHAEFRARGRLHVASFLEEEDAERLLRYLQTAEIWKLVFNSGDKLFELDRQVQGALTAEQREQLDQAVHAQARYGFQFCYETMRVPDAEAQRQVSGTLLDQFASFLSSERALNFLRTVTGEPAITFADAQATAYGPGHFLTAHDDGVAGKNRKAAFVINLSPDWSADWGGLLAFHERGVGPAQAIVPTFNALNLFSVPQLHSVTMVAPFAPRRRYSVTGWLRTGVKS